MIAVVIFVISFREKRDICELLFSILLLIHIQRVKRGRVIYFDIKKNNKAPISYHKL